MDQFEDSHNAIHPPQPVPPSPAGLPLNTAVWYVSVEVLTPGDAWRRLETKT